MRTMLAAAKEAYGARDMLRVRTKENGARDWRRRILSDMDALGNALLGLGLADAHIAVIGPTSYEWQLTYYAVQCGVGVIVPIDKELPDGEIANILQTAARGRLFFSGEYADTVENIRGGLAAVKYYIDMRAEKTAEIRLVSAGLIREAKDSGMSSGKSTKMRCPPCCIRRARREKQGCDADAEEYPFRFGRRAFPARPRAGL